MFSLQVLIKRNFVANLLVLGLVSLLVSCQARYGFRDKVRVFAKEEVKGVESVKIAPILVRSEANIFDRKFELENPTISNVTYEIKESPKAPIATLKEFRVETLKVKNANGYFRNPSSPQKANPWFAGFVIAMAVGLILLILFAPPALLVGVLILVLLVIFLARIIGKGSSNRGETKLGKKSREAARQNRRHRAVVLFMLLSIIFLFLGSIFFYPLIVPLLLCIPLLIVSFIAFKNEPTKGRKLLYLLGLLFGLFLTIFFTAAIISFAPYTD
jgi:hypothetical protein